MNTGRCDSCDATVVWALTPAGKPMPVDAVPVESGNVMLGRVEGFGTLAIILSGEAIERIGRTGRPLHTSHFFTCPDAALHRKR